jgi:hypothetical protein
MNATIWGKTCGETRNPQTACWERGGFEPSSPFISRSFGDLVGHFEISGENIADHVAALFLNKMTVALRPKLPG